jgi:hypothetical protein
LVFGAIALVASRPPIDPDLFWHLAAGRWIWEHSAIPRVDPFSWTAPQRKWIAHEWLTEAVWHQLFRIGGWTALIVLNALVIIGAFVIVRNTARRLGASEGAAVALTGIAAASCVHTWDVRPQMISILLTALFVSLFSKSSGRDVIRQRALWWCVPVMLLWTNLHGGWIFGMAMLVAFSFATVAEYIVHRIPLLKQNFRSSTSQSPTALQLWRSVGVTIASTVVCFINPNGVEGVVYPFSYLGDNASTRYVDEWRAPQISNPQYWAFFLLLALFLVVLFVHRKRVPFYAFSVGIPFGFLAVQSVRNVSQFAVVAAPVVSAAITNALSARSSQRKNIAPSSPGKRGVDAKVIGRINAVVLALIVTAIAALALPGLTPGAAQAAQQREFPVAAVNALKDNVGTRLLNDYDWGGYLLLKAPGIPVSIDGRPDMYGDTFVDTYLSMWWSEPGWENLLRTYGGDRVLAKPQSSIAKHLRKTKGWTVLFEDHKAVLFGLNV